MLKKYFGSSILFSVIGLMLCAWVGYFYGGTAAAALQALFIGAVLGILEVSLSFDNAIVNAVVLKKMTSLWRQRFLTWGMLIAVFGMRLVFPLAIVTILGGISPWDALVLAATDPQEYARIMLNSHIQVAAFGGAFLMMVTLKYFYDQEKELHWIPWIERPVSFVGKVQAIEIVVTLALLLLIQRAMPEYQRLPFILSGLGGIIAYVLVDGISSFLGASEETIKDMNKASAGMFLYLEVLDASFSFDGVVGAFAITNNLFIIMIGLSIGAFFVRSLTILFVEKETLSKFAYLEHGAFYAIGILAGIMLLSPFMHIPEWITGLAGAFIIGAATLWSIYFAPVENGKH